MDRYIYESHRVSSGPCADIEYCFLIIDTNHIGSYLDTNSSAMATTYIEEHAEIIVDALNFAD